MKNVSKFNKWGGREWKTFLMYSYLPNKRGGPNKQGGWKMFQNLINGEGNNVPNKRGGWKIS